MKKCLIILSLCFINFYHSKAQDILNTITSVYVDRVKIESNSEDLKINIKKQKQKYVFQIQYKKIKTIFPIFYSELHNVDSISVRINSLAKKRVVNVGEVFIYKPKFGHGISKCIRCVDDGVFYKSEVTIYRRSQEW